MEKPKWIIEAEKNVHIDLEQDVLVDQFEEMFHKPKKMGSSVDMNRTSMNEATDLNKDIQAIPCSRCYPNLHSFQKTIEKKEINDLGL